MVEWLLLISGAVVGFALALLLAGILLRLACLLCRVDQPRLLRATFIAAIAGVASILAVLCVDVSIYTLLDPQTYETSYVLSIVSFLLGLLSAAIVSSILFKVLLRVAWWKAILIWLVQWLMSVALLAIIALLAFVGTLVNPTF